MLLGSSNVQAPRPAGHSSQRTGASFGRCVANSRCAYLLHIAMARSSLKRIEVHPFGIAGLLECAGSMSSAMQLVGATPFGWSWGAVRTARATVVLVLLRSAARFASHPRPAPCCAASPFMKPFHEVCATCAPAVAPQMTCSSFSPVATRRQTRRCAQTRLAEAAEARVLHASMWLHNCCQRHPQRLQPQQAL